MATAPHSNESPGFARITPEQLFAHFSTIQTRGLRFRAEDRPPGARLCPLAVAAELTP